MSNIQPDIQDINDLAGKTVLVGLSHFNTNMELVGQEQFFGTIISQKKATFEIVIEDSESRQIPAWGLVVAPRGTYTCVSNGEVIKNPDYLISWCIAPDDEDTGSTGLWRVHSAPSFQKDVPAEWKFEYDSDPEYQKMMIDQKGQEYIGKKVLIGLHYYRKTNTGDLEYVEQKQVYGIIKAVTHKYIGVDLSNGEPHSLPPDLSFLQPAEEGEYTLRSTGETISDVDYLTIWHVTKKAE